MGEFAHPFPAMIHEWWLAERVCRGKMRRTKEQDVIVAPERHEYTRALVNRRRLDIVEGAAIPQADLTIAHLAESSRRNPIVVAHPYHTGTLGVHELRRQPRMQAHIPSRRHAPRPP